MFSFFGFSLNFFVHIYLFSKELSNKNFYTFHILHKTWPLLLQRFKCYIAFEARRQYLTVKSLSTESAKSSASSRGSDTCPGQKSFGGSYSTYGGGNKMLILKNIKISSQRILLLLLEWNFKDIEYS